jgi:hypothetical protein
MIARGLKARPAERPVNGHPATMSMTTSRSTRAMTRRCKPMCRDFAIDGINPTARILKARLAIAPHEKSPAAGKSRTAGRCEMGKNER